MSRRYYPGTRERLTRAFDEGVKAAKHFDPGRPYGNRNSGRPLNRAFWRGFVIARGYASDRQWRLPVVDLSAEFADVIRDVEPALAAKLEVAA